MDLRDKLSELNPDALIVEGYDEALIGIGCRYTEAACAVYSEEKIIEILEQEMGEKAKTKRGISQYMHLLTASQCCI